jgi:hypothetical protein
MRRSLRWRLGGALSAAVAVMAVVAFAEGGSSEGTALAAPPVPSTTANVQVVNTSASPVPVAQIVDEIRTPRSVTLTALLADGVSFMSDSKLLSDDKWFVVQAVSAEGETPADQSFWGATLYTRYYTPSSSQGLDAARVVVTPAESCSEGDGVTYSWMNAAACQFYVAPGTSLQIDVHRNSSMGEAHFTVHVTGYLTDKPQVGNN